MPESRTKGDAYFVAGIPGKHKHPVANARSGPGHVFEFKQRGLPELLSTLHPLHPFCDARLADKDDDLRQLPEYFDIIVEIPPVEDYASIVQNDSSFLVGVFIPFRTKKLKVAEHLRQRFGNASILLVLDKEPVESPA